MAKPGLLFVIGGGGREHSLVWHLHTHYPRAAIHCAPGNPGIARLATCHAIPLHQFDGLAQAAAELGADLTIVGPEAPLVGGLADRLAALGLPVIGPTAAAASLEGSKVFAKDLMRRHGIPTAEYAAFDAPDEALAHLRRTSGPVVVKADGLAAGKGVVVCDDGGEARRAVESILGARVFGDAGRRIVIEERLEGHETSVFALVDGEAVTLLPAAQDHKRIWDGDLGPNTGGMGAAAPHMLPGALRRRILREIVEPVAAAMCQEGRPYHGVLFVGLMLTREGPRVLEFNCRLGDPEAQAVLPLLTVGLPDAFDELRSGRLNADHPVMADGAACAVVLASRGYPGAPDTGMPIEGIEDAAQDGLVFHSGTALREGRLVTAGGRVLTIVGQGHALQEAQALAYRAAGRVHFEGMQFRRDVGARLLSATAPAAGR